jgi:hypothetical protein
MVLICQINLLLSGLVLRAVMVAHIMMIGLFGIILALTNNNFMGDRRLLASFPNANAALQNFTPSAGNAFACVNQVPPVDTTFIDGAAAGNISEFTKMQLLLRQMILRQWSCLRAFI